MKKRIFTLFLALAMVLTLAVGAAATGTEHSPALQMEVVQGEHEVAISVYLTGCAEVTNGRFIVKYDGEKLGQPRVETTTAYAVSSVNTNEAGAVALAWVGSQLQQDQTLMLTVYLKVTAPITEDMAYSVVADGIYTEAGAVDVADDQVLMNYVDLTELNLAIAAAAELNPGAYTAESYAAVEAALDVAMALLSNPDATQAQVDAAAEALRAAIGALELLPEPVVDFSKLQAAVENAQSLNAEDYTAESFAAVEAALEQARQVLANPDATQEEVDAAEKALQDAVAALEKAPVVVPVDFTELQKAIELAEKLDGAQFTEASFQAMQAELKQAKLVLIDPLATQEQVDLATKRLNDAIAALEKVGEPSPPTGDESGFAALVVLSLAALAGMLMLIIRAKKQEKVMKLLSIVLVAVMLLTMLPAGAIAAGLKDGNAERNELFAQLMGDPGWDLTRDQGLDKLNPNQYKENDLVRVIVELDDAGLLEKGYSKGEIAAYGTKVSAYAKALKIRQNNISAQIEKLAGRSGLVSTMSKDDQAAVAKVKYQYTVALNGIAMSLPYGMLDAVRKIDGVKAVYICSEYTLPEEAKSASNIGPLMQSSGDLVSAGKAWNDLGYTGQGMTIAIIDTGLDLDHPSFADAPAGASMTEADVANVLKELNAFYLYGQTSAVALTADKLYRSEKVPYAFNYVDRGLDVTHDYDSQGDHGTHVAGSAAANKLETTGVVGIAPDAQLVVMKVFGQNGGAFTEDIMAALEDCILMDVDSVNMSLGAPGGFTEESVLINEVFRRVLDCDMVLAVAAGNSNSAAYGNGLGTNLNLTSDPDNGITTSPGTYIGGTQVGSFENSFVMMPYFTAGELNVPYVDVSVGFTALAGQQLEYVMVPGYGRVEDYEGLDLQGKVAVVSRGGGDEVTFVVKQQNAYDAGAVALIVYNNVEGELLSMFDAGILPNVFISKANGEKMRAEAGEDGVGPIEIMPLTMEIPMESPLAGTMSDFSSWGVTSDLLLAPDVSAPGGNIYSCINDGKYGIMSGTSMASPHVAGMAALLLQYLHAEHPELTEQQMHVAAESLLMCTADPMLDPDGILYSPRKQGAGAADIYNALTSPVYLTVQQANGEWTPKVSFGDDPQRTGVYNFSFQMHNYGTTQQIFVLDGVIMTDQYVLLEDGREYMGETGRMLTGDVIFEVLSGEAKPEWDANQDGMVTMDDVQLLLDVVNGVKTLDTSLKEMMDLDGNGVLNTVDAQLLYVKILSGYQPEKRVVVEAGSSITVNVTVQLSEADMAYMDQHYENGIYVEGFIRCYAENEDGRDLSLPYMGFYGEWSDAPMIDSGWYYEDAETVEYNRYLNVLYSNMGSSYGGLGLNPYLTNEKYDPAHNVLSPNGDGYYDNVSEMYISLLRSAELMTFTWTDENGTELFDDYLIYLKKSYYWAAYGMCLPMVYTEQGGSIFMMHDEGGNSLFDELTRLNLTIRGYLDDGDLDEVDVDVDGSPLPNTAWADDVVEVPVIIDTTAPTMDVNSLVYETKNGRNYVSFQVEDNYDLAALVTTTLGGDVYDYMAVTGKQEGVDGEKTTVTVDITGYDKSFVVVLCDYGCNETYYEVTNLEGGQMDESRFYGFRRYCTPVMGDSIYMTDQLNGWYSFESADEMLMHTSQPQTGEASVFAAEYVDGYIFGAQAGQYNDANMLFVMKEGSWERTILGSEYGMRTTVYQWPGSTNSYFPLSLIALDMAYDYTTDTMYMLANALENSYFPEGVENMLLSIDLMTGAYTILGLIQEENGAAFGALTLACDNDGILYTVNYEDGKIYTIDKEASSEEAGMGFYTARCLSQRETPYYPSAYTQSMAVDHETNRLYWAGYQGRTGNAYFFEVDKTTGELLSFTNTEDNAEITGLFKPYDCGRDIIADAQLTGIRLNHSSLYLQVGQNATLRVTAEPFNGKLGQMTYTSMDPSIASVSPTGIVEAKKAGTVNILVTCMSEDGQYYDTICQVNVSSVSGTLFAHSGDYWLMMDAQSPMNALQIVDAMVLDGRVAAAAYFQGSIYAAAVLEDYDTMVFTTNLYKLDPNTLTGELLGTYEGETTALAFSYADGFMYAMIRNLDDDWCYDYQLAKVNLRTGMLENGADLNGLFDNADEYETCSGALAIDYEGNFYVTGEQSVGDWEYANVLVRFNLDENGQLTNVTTWDQLPSYSADGGEAMVWSERNGGILRSTVDPDNGTYNLYWLDVSNMNNVEMVGLGEVRGSAYPGVTALVIPLNWEPQMPEIPATEVFLDASYSVFQGETVRVIPYTEPWNASADFVYEIADPTVAGVDKNGVVTGLSIGTTTITVRIPGTDLSATATIEVLKNPGYLYGFFQADIAQSVPLEQWGKIPVANTADSIFLTSNAYDFTIYAAAFYDGYVYAYGKSQYDYMFHFLRISPSNFSYEVISQGDVLIRDMAFDFTTGTLYAIGNTEMVAGGLYQINVDTGEMTLVSDNSRKAALVALAVDDAGVFYVADDKANVMIMDKNTGRLTDTGIQGTPSVYLQAMTYDYNNDAIYWAVGGKMLQVDVENGQLLTLGAADVNSGEMFTVGCVVSGLFSVPSADKMPVLPETVEPEGVVLDERDTVAVGNTLQIPAVVLPVSQSEVDQTLVWTSLNEAIATVDQFGNVTGVSAGQVFITATDVNGHMDTILITVTEQERKFYGYDEISRSWVSFGMDGKIVATWPDAEDLSPIVAAQYIGQTLYAYDADGYFYSVDTQTFTRTKLGDGIHGRTVDLETWDRDGTGWNYDVPYQVIDMTYYQTGRSIIAYAVIQAYSISEWMDSFDYQVVQIDLTSGEITKVLVDNKLVDNEMTLRPSNLIYRNGYLYTVNGYISGMVTQIDPLRGTVTGTAIFPGYWGDFNGGRSLIEDPLTGEVYGILDMRTPYIGEVDYDASIAQSVLCTVDLGVAGCEEVCTIGSNMRICGLFIK